MDQGEGTMNPTLIVVPARGGSQGIPRKAVRILGTKPPLRWTLDTVRAIPHADVAVVTDDPEIRALAGDVLTFPEPPGIPGARTLDPVVYATVLAAEAQRGHPYEYVATVQCTTPFLSRATVQACLNALATHPSALTVMDDRHLRIGGAWVIRQEMAPCWRITGGCIASRREHVTAARRLQFLGAHPVVVSGPEALDLDTMEDWAIAEQYAGMTMRERLLMRVLGSACPHRGLIVPLSGWDESPAEFAARGVRASEFVGRVVPLHGPHTHAEAVQFMGERHEEDGADVILVTSAYHQLRVFLTFLAVLKDWGLDRTVRLWNAPAPSGMEKLALEWQKITDYQQKGHVASYDDGLVYLDWRDSAAS